MYIDILTPTWTSSVARKIIINAFVSAFVDGVNVIAFVVAIKSIQSVVTLAMTRSSPILALSVAHPNFYLFAYVLFAVSLFITGKHS